MDSRRRVGSDFRLLQAFDARGWRLVIEKGTG
jgi:hypothetical protein